MKNVTKILTAAVLCAAIFASDQRIDALGGNAAFWPGDEANIGMFPAQVNNHSFVQIDGVGCDSWDETTGACDGSDNGGVSLLTSKDGTSWGFNYGSNEWVNMSWGNGDMGVVVGMTGGDAASAMSVSWGGDFGFGELGVHYTDTGDGTLGVAWRKDCGFWIFDNAVVVADDLMADDLGFSASMFTHMDAGGADVMFAWGMNYDGADDGGIDQTATIGVEANMTDWATLRAGYNWEYVLTNDAAGGVTGGVTDGFSYGLGFNWGGLTCDMDVESGLFQDPVSTLTGQDDGAALTTGTMTFTYNF
jgi:hypothetical protein